MPNTATSDTPPTTHANATMPAATAATAAWVSVADAEGAARAVLPRPVFDYIAGGAEDEASVRANRDAFARYAFRPRVLTDVSRLSLATEILGTRLAAPFAVAPHALHGMYHPDAEGGTYRAAARAGWLYTASSAGSVPLETVAAAADGPRWFQLYAFRERAVAATLVQAAAAAGYTALVLTADVQVLGRRERDLRHAFALPDGVRMRNFERRFGDLPADTATAHLANVANPALTWADLAWIRNLSALPVIVKGILTAEDAALAVAHGAAAVWVSNHGGRQLDGAIAALDALPEVVAAVRGRVPVILDGGVRRGTDALKALALGANLVAVGRPVLYGLAAGGEAGAHAVMTMLTAELHTALTLCGVPSLAAVGPSLVQKSAACCVLRVADDADDRRP